MPEAGLSMGISLVEDRDHREFSRIPVVIPVRVEILPACQGDVFAAVPGALLNIGRGGARLRVGWEFHPRTRLFISLPKGIPNLRLLAEVIWPAPVSGRGGASALCGVRWVEPLSPDALESVLLRQGLSAKTEAAHGFRA